MNERRRQIRRERAILLCLFVVLVIGYAVYGVKLYLFNSTVRNCGERSADGAVTLVCAPRTGKTDSWVKNIDENGQTVAYNGTIYDITLSDAGADGISKWKLRLDIGEDCFLNNAWCGRFEIHQFTNGTERVQTLDLRDYNREDVTLLYRMEGPDLMIPLHAGDYLVYHPDLSANEYPIGAMQGNTPSEIVFGMIFYTVNAEPVTFPSFELSYYLCKSFFSGTVSILLLVLSGVWFVFLCVTLSVEWNMKKAHERFHQDERIINQSIGVFTHFFEAKDTYTTGHSQRVADYSNLIAQRLGMSEDECREVYYTALMHDCGKCYIPDEILKKPGRLNDEEYAVIKSHTVRGAQMVEALTAVAPMHDGVKYHHERFDGKGYPSGLAGENIPLVSRIICISDSFDAMNSRRCYRDNLSREKILDELRKGSGTQFDPRMVKIMLQLIDEGKITMNGAQ